MVIVKGSECVLRMEGVEGDLDSIGVTFPAGYVIAHDLTGMYLSPCDFYIAKFVRSRAAVGEANDHADSRVAASRYFGDRSRLSDGALELPDGRWKHVGRVTEIGYRRLGERKGLYQHNYASPIQLQGCREGRVRAWRLRLPHDCVADERGFVRP